MRAPRLSAPDAREYERIKGENAELKAQNFQLMDQNAQANAEIARYRLIISGMERERLQHQNICDTVAVVTRH